MQSSHNHRQALQLLQQGDWDGAHQLIQNYSDPLSCRIHALLHRIEGDVGNAGYWYRRADSDLPGNTIDEELLLLLNMASLT